ncbi:MAG: WG repeat-containing protein, partial [Chitinophagaceae bacterium]
MFKISFLISVLLISLNAFSQSQDPWVRFTDPASRLSGYKNLKGEVMIPPRFNGVPCADTFYNIIGVTEMNDKTFKNYYLLKDGRVIGEDSLYIFDYTTDCESEGKIMFSDRKNDRVGFFDKNGKVVIPAVYNYASPFHNGFSIAHLNAKRKCLDGEDMHNCEHPTWEGGETVLINEKNEVLADDVPIDLYGVDWHSVR